MTFTPDKDGVVTGTEEKDKIVYQTTYEWKRALIVNALGGNDTIDFRKSSYKNTLNGDDGDDIIYGGSNDDTIYGGVGNDSISGGKGNDKIYAGAGNDTISGGKGNDLIYTEEGNNTITFNEGDGADTIYKGTGSDTVVFNNLASIDELEFDLTLSKSGYHLVIEYSDEDKVILSNYYKNNQGTSVETLKAKDGSAISLNNFYNYIYYNYITGQWSAENNLTGTSFNDTIIGGSLKDTINGSAGNDLIHGNGGNDTLKGASGDDRIYGGEGNDNIIGGTGDDILKPGEGKNKLYFYAGDGADTIYSTEGATDILYFTDTNFDDLRFLKRNNHLIISGYGDESDYVCVMDYYKSSNYAHPVKTIQTKDKKISLAKAITQSAELHPNEITGEHIVGTNGDDILYGTDDNDVIHGKLGADTIYGYSGDDTLEAFIDAKLYGGAGNDYLRVDYGFSELDGGIGHDVIYAQGPHNTVYGGDGCDYINAGYASYVDAGKGHDYIYLSGDSAIYDGSTVYGGQGDDYIGVSTSYSKIYGGCGDFTVPSGNDTLQMNQNAMYNTIYLEDGNNTIQLGGYNNTVYSEGRTTVTTSTGSNNTLILGNEGNSISLSSNIKNLTIKTGSSADTVQMSNGQGHEIYLGDGPDVVEMGYNVIDCLVCGENGDDIYNFNSLFYPGNVTIYDNSGYDTLNFKNNQDPKLDLYVNVYADGTYDNDLVFTSFNKNKDYQQGICTIQNYMTDGKIESIKRYNNYHISDANLNSAIQQTASWLSTSGYDSVQDVIDGGNHTDIDNVIAYFSTAWVQ